MAVMRRISAVALLAALLLSVAPGCGNQGPKPETVWLHVFNAYPGVSSLSLYGPNGAVTTDLPFGKRTNSYQSVDRNLGTDFTLILEGAPTTFEISLPLYDMYPHESGTVFFKRRSGADTVDEPIVFRHVQTGYTEEDKQCRLILDNAISAQNDDIAIFNYVPAMKIRPSCTGYVDEIGTYNDRDQMAEAKNGQMIQVGRPWLHNTNNNKKPEFVRQPWFIPADAQGGGIVDVRNVKNGKCPALDSTPDDNKNKRDQQVVGEDTVEFIWAPQADVDYESGTFTAAPPTRQYMDCIGWDPDKNANRQSIESDQVDKCQGTQQTTDVVKLNNEVVSLRFPAGIGLKSNGDNLTSKQCGFEQTIMSDFFNVFKEPGDKKKKEAVTRMIKYKPSQYYFWVLYGRPVNPLVEEWGANTPGRGGGFVELPNYPGNAGN